MEVPTMARSRISRALVLGTLVTSAMAASTVSAQTPTPLTRSGEPLIVYNGGVGAGTGIRLVGPDGSGDRSIFEGQFEGEAWHPDWSHDGERIAFAVDDSDGTRDLWVGSVDGASAERVYDCAAPCGWADEPSWSPDDRTILFQQGSAVGTEGLGVGTVEALDVGSRERNTVYTGGDTEYLYVPRWAPDGERIVVEVDRFASARLDESRIIDTSIVVVDARKGGPAVPLVLDRRAVYPDWSPEGDLIVFQAPVDPQAPDGPSDLFVIAASGGSPVLLTATGAAGRQALQPSWTPDGRIIFVEQDAMFENVRMAVIDADGQNLASATGELDLFGTHPRLRAVAPDD
jgi:Tol biopolymer transport system component